MSETQSDPGLRTQPEPAAPAMQAPVSPKPRGRTIPAFLTIAILVLLAGAVALTVQRLRTGNAREVTLSDLARDVAALKNGDTRVAATLEKSSSESQAANAAIADLTMRLGTIEAEMTRAADRDALARLQERIAQSSRRNACPRQSLARGG